MATEKRLIDANVAIERAKNSDKIIGSSIWETGEVVEFLEDCPIVDAVEVVHGRFESIRYGYGCLQIATCSVCGEKQGLYINGRLPSWNYCPNCGAKTDGGS